MKYWERNLTDWNPDIITKARQSENGLWYAVLDCGPITYPSDMDCLACAKTKENAIQLCYQSIVQHRTRINNYDLHFRLGKWWRIKELGLHTSPEIIDITSHYWEQRHRLFKDYEIPEDLQ